MATQPLCVCEHCDAVYRRRALARREIARCLRCGAELYRDQRYGLNAMLALTLTALIVFVIANVYPIVRIEVQGVASEATLWGAIMATWNSGVGVVAALAAATVFFFPLSQIALFLHVLPALRRGRVPVHFRDAMHALRLVQPWSMVEVFLLGALVSVVKLAGLAEVIPGIGLWAFGILTLLLTTLTGFDLRRLWEIADGARR